MDVFSVGLTTPWPHPPHPCGKGEWRDIAPAVNPLLLAALGKKRAWNQFLLAGHLAFDGVEQSRRKSDLP